jgi:hypothetical protein
MPAETEILTFQDAVEQILDVYGGERSSREHRNAIRAVLEIRREFPSEAQWSYLQWRTQIKTVASQSSSTITYDHTGGAYERVVTLASGTWPSWARFGRITLDDVSYPIEDRKSSTEITLMAGQNPGSDLAAGATYEIYRDAYPLPIGFRKHHGVYDLQGDYELQCATPAEQQAYSVYSTSPSRPVLFTIRNAREYYGGLEIVFSPPPSSIRTYDFVYERALLPLVTEKLATGTVTTSTTTVTCSSNVFAAKHKGAIIRFSDGATEPTGRIGLIAGTDNPYVAQRTVMSVEATISLTIDAALTTELSGVAYTISDPLDLEPHSMLNAFLRCCEARFARMTIREDRREREASAREALIQAMGADSRYAGYSVAGDGGGMSVPFHLRGWSTVPDEIVNPNS